MMKTIDDLPEVVRQLLVTVSRSAESFHKDAIVLSRADVIRLCLFTLERASLDRQAAPEPRWVPVGERPPKKAGAYPVLVGKYHALRVSNWNEYNGGFRWTEQAYITHWLDGLPPAPLSGEKAP